MAVRSTTEEDQAVEVRIDHKMCLAEEGGLHVPDRIMIAVDIPAPGPGDRIAAANSQNETSEVDDETVRGVEEAEEEEGNA